MHAGSRNPFTDLLLKHLPLQSANSRIVAALLISAWAKASHQAQAPLGTSSVPNAAAMSDQPTQATTEAIPGQGFPQQELVPALAAVLAAPAVAQLADGRVQPFTELSSSYALMQQHAQVHQVPAMPTMHACHQRSLLYTTWCLQELVVHYTT